ncbi:MAG: methyltransferase domain-containing protein [Acidobacteriota bacterium]
MEPAAPEAGAAAEEPAAGAIAPDGREGGPVNPPRVLTSRRQAQEGFLTRSRELAHVAPAAVRGQGPLWKRMARAVMGRLIGFHTARQQEYNHATVAVLEHLVLQEHLLESSLDAATARQDSLHRRLSELENALGRLRERIDAAGTELRSMAAGQRQHAEEMQRRMGKAEQEAAQVREATARVAWASRSVQDQAANHERWARAQVERLHARMETLREAGKSLRSALADAARQVTELEKSGGQQQDRMRTLEGRLDLLQAEHSHAKREAGADRKRLEEAIQRINQEEIQFNIQEFADRFRGSEQEIRRRMRRYIDLLRAGGVQNIGPIVELGSGRGEFLELCREAGLRARGVDRDAAGVESLQARGLEAHVGEGLEYLQALRAGSVGAVLAVQVIEHLPPGVLQGVIESSFRALARGGLLILESLNPACLSMFATTFYRDPTHRRPVHPDTVAFLMKEVGFGAVRVVTHSPVPDAARLDLLSNDRAADAAVRQLRSDIDQRLQQLNHLLFSDQEYHVIGSKT